MTRRRPFLLGLLLGGAAVPPAFAAAPWRVAALDYGLAETLLALGTVPVGLPDPADYRLWVVDPALPAGPPGPVDLGQRTQPNLELLAGLAPDCILAVADHDPILPQLRRIAPVLRLPLQTAAADPWARSVEAARAIGAMLGRTAEAAALVAAAEAGLADARGQLRGQAQDRPRRPVLLASFLDARHLMVYGAGSILQAALDRLGVRNAWTRPTGRYGSATVGLEQLAGFADATLYVFEPQPPEVAAALAASPLWQALPFVRGGRVVALPPVLMFGTLPAASRFGRLLLPHLLSEAALG
ncbi:MAG: ABC transporter substrate-binding protein [Janthinobacterium lividum]